MIDHFQVSLATPRLSPVKSPYYHAGMVGAGRFRVSVGLTEFEAAPGTIWFVPPQQIHAFEDLEGGSSAYVMTYCPGYALKEHANKNLLHDLPFHSPLQCPYLVLDGPCAGRLYTVFETAHLEQEAARKNRDELTRLKLLEVLLTAERHYRESAPASTSKTTDLIYRFKALIDEHFLRHLPPAAYADLLGVHPNYLNRAAKTLINKTCSDLINERMKLEAVWLLLHTTLLIPEISARLGFEETPHFTRFFRRQTGEAPGKFRKALSHA
jgi:AraC-like DNA-binding protein